MTLGRRIKDAWRLLRGEAPEPPSARQAGTLDEDGTPCRGRPADDLPTDLDRVDEGSDL
jgi:hypothetical protein